MARAALDWTLDDLATRASIAKNTIVRFENDAGEVRPANVAKLQAVLEAEGISFEGDTGVRCDGFLVRS
jgi:transcriptional regulator with XRE-family HTH domain